MSHDQPRIGRPRDPGKDHAVLVATRRLLGEVGYQQTTIMAIARAAGVSAPAIYRRWATREALIEDAVHGPGAHALPEPTDDLYADLLTWTKIFLARAASPAARSGVPGLLSTATAGVDQARLLAREAPVREAFAARLERAADTGEIPAPVDASVLFEILTGTTSLRGLTRGDADADAFATAIAGALHVLALHGTTPSSESETAHED